MTDILPSDCPNYTIIDDPVYGLYLKEDFHLWTQVHPAADQENPYIVSDKGFYDMDDLPSNFVLEKADDVFGEFEIRSLPVGWRLPKTPQTSQFDWWPIPEHPHYLIRSDGLRVRGKRDGSRRAKNKTITGYFLLYKDGVPTRWSPSALGDADQIKHFLETGTPLLKGETIDVFG